MLVASRCLLGAGEDRETSPRLLLPSCTLCLAAVWSRVSVPGTARSHSSTAVWSPSLTCSCLSLASSPNTSLTRRDSCSARRHQNKSRLQIIILVLLVSCEIPGGCELVLCGCELQDQFQVFLSQRSLVFRLHPRPRLLYCLRNTFILGDSWHPLVSFLHWATGGFTELGGIEI